MNAGLLVLSTIVSNKGVAGLELTPLSELTGNNSFHLDSSFVLSFPDQQATYTAAISLPLQHIMLMECSNMEGEETLKKRALVLAALTAAHGNIGTLLYLDCSTLTGHEVAICAESAAKLRRQCRSLAIPQKQCFLSLHLSNEGTNTQ